MGDVAFVVLRKRDGLLQCVYEEGKSGFDLKDLKEACTVEVEGILNEEQRAQVELKYGSEASRSSPLRVHPCRFRLQNGN